MLKRISIIDNHALRHATPQEIEEYYSAQDEQEHYKQLAEQDAWMGGDND